MPTLRARDSRSSARRGLLALVLLVLLGSARGQAEVPAEPSPYIVQVMLVGKVGRVLAFSERVTSWFDAERFRVSVRAVAGLDASRILSPKRDGAVYVWVSSTQPSGARLYFATRSDVDARATYLVRDLHLESGLDEMGAERIAQVLHLSTVALLEGQAASRREEVEQMLRREPSAPTKPESKAPPLQQEDKARQPRGTPRGRGPTRDPSVGPAAGAKGRLGGAVGYGASYRSDEGVWHGPRLRALVGLADGWGIQGVVQSAWPQTRNMDAVALKLYGVSGGLVVSVHHGLASGYKLEWVAGPGLEVVHYAPLRSLEPSVTPGGSDTEARPTVMAAVAALLGGSPLALAVVAECAVALVPTHYNVAVGGEYREIGRAARVAPSLGLEGRF